MARIILSLAVFFFLLVLSHARAPLNRPVNDVNLLRSAIIGIPSEESHSHPNTFVELQPEAKLESNGEAQPDEPAGASSGSQVLTVDVIPLTKPMTFVNFRPINRHFRVGRSYFPRRECHKHRLRPFNPVPRPRQFQQAQRGYDMMSSLAKNAESSRTMRQHIPAGRWVRFMHQQPRREDHVDSIKKDKSMRPQRGGEAEEMDVPKMEEKKEESSVMKRIRKYLINF